MTNLSLILIFVFAYLLGAVPFGFILGKLVKKIDIRQYGSGNIGATNVLRTLGTGWGTFAFVLDVFKGFFPAFIAGKLGFNPWLVVLAGAVAVLGHSFSVFLNFRGGKGVASSLGVIFAFNPIIAVLGLVIFAVVVAVCRYVSLGSCIATFGVFAMTLFWPGSAVAYKIVVGILFLAIIIKHIPNFKRLANGTENKFGNKVKIPQDK